MITKPIPCPKCGKNLEIADDEYDKYYRCYVVKVYCEHCGYGGIVQVTKEWVDDV